MKFFNKYFKFGYCLNWLYEDENVYFSFGAFKHKHKELLGYTFYLSMWKYRFDFTYYKSYTNLLKYKQKRKRI